MRNVGSGKIAKVEDAAREADRVRTLLSNLPVIWGNGSPEGVESASVGTLYLNLQGGATTLWIKESGDTGTGGWVPRNIISGGSIDGTEIGSTTRSTGKFTSINANAAGSSIVCEAWHEIGAAGEPAFMNSWENYGGGLGYHPAAFFKDPFGIVHLTGLIKNGMTGVVFTLPSGYRPATTESGVAVDGDYATKPAFYNISAAGVFTAGYTNNAWFALGNIAFKAG